MKVNRNRRLRAKRRQDRRTTEEKVVAHRRRIIDRADRRWFLVLLWGSVIILSSVYAFVYTQAIPDVWGNLAVWICLGVWAVYMLNATVGRYIELQRTRYAFRIRWFWNLFLNTLQNTFGTLYRRFVSLRK